jgi:hypothetical protein
VELHRHDQLLQALKETYTGVLIDIHFTQWDSDEEDEEVTLFRGSLTEVELTDNEFGEKDLRLTFATDSDEEVEILMEIPQEEEDLGALQDGELRIFGTEAELVLVLR